jgi:uncharacterized CHY-type Zn-finger protein
MPRRRYCTVLCKAFDVEGESRELALERIRGGDLWTSQRTPHRVVKRVDVLSASETLHPFQHVLMFVRDEFSLVQSHQHMLASTVIRSCGTCDVIFQRFDCRDRIPIDAIAFTSHNLPASSAVKCRSCGSLILSVESAMPVICRFCEQIHAYVRPQGEPFSSDFEDGWAERESCAKGSASTYHDLARMTRNQSQYLKQHL